MSAPEVSVVLAVRDGAESLEASLVSVLDQEGVDLELIAVDDGSRDATPKILADRAERDPRVCVLRQEPGGLTAALRVGCAAARAPWIARQDARDESLPGRLRRQLDATRDRPRLALVSCFTECLAPGGEPLYVERGRAEPDLERPLFDGPEPDARHVGPTSHGSALFRRALYEQVGGYRLEFPLGQDWDLWLRLGEVGTYRTVGAPLYRRRFSPTSASFQRRDLQMAFGEASTEASLRRRRGESEEPALARARLLAERWRRERPARGARGEALALYHFGETLRRRRDPAGRAYLLAAARRDPTALRTWLRLAQCLITSSRRAAPLAEQGR